MTAGDATPGRRRDDVPFGELPDDPLPGDYWRYLTPDGSTLMLVDRPGNLTRGAWGFCAPGGCGIGTLMAHTVREDEDGVATIAPGDGSSNSVLIYGGGDGRSWHGYLDHGVWREC